MGRGRRRKEERRESGELAGEMVGIAEETGQRRDVLEHNRFLICSSILQNQLTILEGLLDCCNLFVGTRAQDFNEALFVCPHPLHCFTQTFGIVEHLVWEREEGRRRVYTCVYMHKLY